MRTALVALILIASVVDAATQEPVPYKTKASYSGVIEATVGTSPPMLFASLDENVYGFPEFGVLMELDNQASNFPSLGARPRGSIYTTAFSGTHPHLRGISV